MDLQQRYQADSEKAEKGVPVLIGDATFKIGYYNSSQIQLAFHSNVQKFKAIMENEEEAVVAGMRETLKENVIFGWDNLEEDGVVLPYSKETCERILNQYVGLDSEIMARSIDLDLFRKDQKKEVQEK